HAKVRDRYRHVIVTPSDSGWGPWRNPSSLASVPPFLSFHSQPCYACTFTLLSQADLDTRPTPRCILVASTPKHQSPATSGLFVTLLAIANSRELILRWASLAAPRFTSNCKASC